MAITIDVRFRDDAVRRGLQQLQRRVNRAMGNIERKSQQSAGSVSEAFSQLGRAATLGLGGVTSVITGLGRGLLDLVGTISKVTLGIGAIGTAVAAIQLKAATKEFIDFDKVVTTAAAKLAISQKDLTFDEANKSLRELAERIGRETPFTAEQAAKGLQALVQTGRSLQEIMDLTNPVVRFAVANHLDLAQAAEEAVLSTALFNLEMKDSGRVMDVFTAAAIKSTANVTVMREAMVFAGRAVAPLGLNVEETAASIALLAKTARTGSIAGSTFARSVSRLALAFKDTKKATELRKDLEELGVDVDQLRSVFTSAVPPGKKMATMLKALEPLAAASDDKLNQLVAIVELFGQRGQGIFPLIQESAKGAFDAMQEGVTNTNANLLITDKVMDTVAIDVALLQSAFSAFKIELVSAFAPALSGILEKFTLLTAHAGPLAEAIGTEIGGAVTFMIDNFEKAFPVFENIAFAFGTLIDIATLIPDAFNFVVASVRALVSAATPALLFLFDVVDFGVQVFTGLVQIIADFVESTRIMVSAVASVGEAFGIEQDTLRNIEVVLEGMVKSTEDFAATTENVRRAVSDQRGEIEGFLGTIGGDFDTQMNKAGESFNRMRDGFDKVGERGERFRDTVRGITEDVRNLNAETAETTLPGGAAVGAGPGALGLAAVGGALGEAVTVDAINSIGDFLRAGMNQAIIQASENEKAKAEAEAQATNSGVPTE